MYNKLLANLLQVFYTLFVIVILLVLDRIPSTRRLLKSSSEELEVVVKSSSGELEVVVKSSSGELEVVVKSSSGELEVVVKSLS